MTEDCGETTIGMGHPLVECLSVLRILRSLFLSRTLIFPILIRLNYILGKEMKHGLKGVQDDWWDMGSYSESGGMKE